MHTEELYPVFNSAIYWPEVHYHYAVLVVFDCLCERRYQLYSAFVREITSEDRIVYGVSETFHGPMHIVQALRVHYVIADYVTVQTAHSITWCRMVDIP